MLISKLKGVLRFLYLIMMLTSPYPVLYHISRVVRQTTIHPPNLVHIFGSVPVASRIRIGMCGLCFFMVGYARFRNDLSGRPSGQNGAGGGSSEAWWEAYLAASLACEEWQRWNRTSLRPEVKAYLAAIVAARRPCRMTAV
jgi:hypothetical protein